MYARYCQLVPNYDQAREKIQELEKQLDDVNKQLQEQEEKHKQLYLQMYNKGIEAAKLEQQEQVQRTINLVIVLHYRYNILYVSHGLCIYTCWTGSSMFNN